ncbi:hypothetical protein FIBSPDRAFT_829519 [Athelia psychrophila]|uniref:Large ribosomal subunit protein mL54 n=1 Tax=Athelia psychrophila TaxID=1759441 RepID=A0A166GXM3_9AGAM|nr:hypothetical protein FIBSPDRAFT_829519 [Fibularhizoctonia sp. CBS 109695]
MSFPRALRTLASSCARTSHPIRGYAGKATKKETASKTDAVLSSCPENTVLTGVNWLKGQPPVLALADEEYPPWLWTLLQPKVSTDEGPGSLTEKRKMKVERKTNIKYANLLKSQ